MQTKHHKTAGCFLIRKNKDLFEVILIYRKWAKDNQGWLPPKGHIEDNETIEDAALRETSEETGYTNIQIVDFIETLNIEYKWYDGILHKKKIHYILQNCFLQEKKFQS